MAEDRPVDPVTYPLYRRTVDRRHVYRIESPDRFTEIQVVGSRLLTHVVHVRAYPEMVRLQEMIAAIDGRYEPMAASDWQELQDRLQNDRG